ncbi:elongation factor 4 [Candidatus Dojkabacteria bacterium]|uniref:Elongation factor 4 n=1 Tax=Candidatus Dojkabacteria bacterium TaxID=2099670 RepID=A0A3M0YY61_9BACT|nr:MAG: elongation factor 4 [Candidatus Dojkabacteria bacterium]
MAIDTSLIRNFCIIAHIDHGKSTLADRLIEFTGALSRREIKDRVLDTLELEQERGITIKLQTARLHYKGFILNLIDTPGHVDFSYEVSRSVAASEGALLLVDATQGVQAQTLSTVYKAMEYDLKIIPVLNKVDMDTADVEGTKEEMMEIFGFSQSEIILASGKTGLGVDKILDTIIKEIPPPDKNKSKVFVPDDNLKVQPTKALVFDAFYHEFLGVTALVKVVAGSFNLSDKLYAIGTCTDISPIELGYLNPKMCKTFELNEGEVGYIATGLKDINLIHVGDTITLKMNDDSHLLVKSLIGYKPPKPMVFASLYPVDSSDFEKFRDALEKLSLNDSSITYQKEFSQALGTGYVCGFLGLLHLEITQERLEKEYGIELITTTPTVEFRIKLKTSDYTKLPINIANIDTKQNLAYIRTAAEFPDPGLVEYVEEPWVSLEVLVPEDYVGSVMELCHKHRGEYISLSYLSNKNIVLRRHAILKFNMPMIEIMISFFDKLKSITNGYASMEYAFTGFRKSEIVKVTILVNSQPAEALSFLTHKVNAQKKGREVVEKLKELIPRQMFKVPIQAAVENQIVARETINPYRKDVLAKLYGGDVTRKLKLLEKQKKGKKKMKLVGNVEIPKEAFLAVLKID